MPTDYARRDDIVRHNVYASVRRRDGMPRAMFADYWRDVHATLCSRLPGLGFYVQQHFHREGGANLWPVADGLRRITAVLDGSAELGFASLADQADFAAASAVLYADEANLFSEAVAYNLPTGSTTFVDRDEDAMPNGPDRFHRVHVYMTRKAGTEADEWLAEASADLARDDAVEKWKLHLPQPYDNARPSPPSPDVGHEVESDRLDLAVIEAAFTSARTARAFFAASPFQRMLAAQSTYLEAIGAYLVSDIYTFVRAGMPTPAGIRGSRSAALIEQVGAANQLMPGIARRFVAATGMPG